MKFIQELDTLTYVAYIGTECSYIITLYIYRERYLHLCVNNTKSNIILYAYLQFKQKRCQHLLSSYSILASSCQRKTWHAMFARAFTFFFCQKIIGLVNLPTTLPSSKIWLRYRRLAAYGLPSILRPYSRRVRSICNIFRWSI